MAALNAAYRSLEQTMRAATTAGVAMGPGRTPPTDPRSPTASAFRPAPGPPEGSLLWRMRKARTLESPMLDFGEYAGWRIADVAEHDPRYLVWLSRHSSGVRFRRAIAEALGSTRDLGRQAAIIS
jgi:hypothetical protein